MARKSYTKHSHLTHYQLRQALTPHTIITNTTPTNKARSTGIILHKNWEIVREQKHESGGLTGVEVKIANTLMFVMCAYLPTALDAYGMNLLTPQKRHMRSIPRHLSWASRTNTGFQEET